MDIKLLPICYLLTLGVFTPLSNHSQYPEDKILEVPAADLSQLSPNDFRDDELDIPYYLAHFHRLANSVVTEGPDKGFINISVWRNPQDNQPYNARIMENILSLAYFYCTDRPWNLYYRHPALKQRLELALDFWCNRQSEEGYFSEYGPEKWNLAATAFSTKFMGETLMMLHQGPSIDSELHQKVIETNCKTILTLLKDKELYASGTYVSNQYSNLWAGAYAFLAIYPDAEMEVLLQQRIQQSMTDFQSPAGYFYEKNGPDWSYNLGTHHSNLLMAWHYAQDKEVGELFIEKANDWYDWFFYNAALEPDRSYYFLNRSIETRKSQQVVNFSREESNGAHPALEREVTMARAVSTTQEEHARFIQATRQQLQAQWPEVAPLPIGEFSAFSPYGFLHRKHTKWFPTHEQKQTAVAKIPYLKKHRFIHQRIDDRKDVQYTFIRKPAYYVAFNSGEKITDQQRYGLGLIWHPALGTFLQAQTGSDTLSWGTRIVDHPTLHECDGFEAVFALNGKKLSPKPGNHDLPGDELTIRYPLGSGGQKTVQFQEDRIAVNIQHPQAFTEHLPLLIGKDTEVEVQVGKTILRKNQRPLVTIYYDRQTEPQLIPGNQTSGEKQISLLTLKASNTLKYAIVAAPYK